MVSLTLQENPKSGLLCIEMIQGKPPVFVSTPRRGMPSPIQAQHIRTLSPAGRTLMVWSDAKNKWEILKIGLISGIDT